MHDIPSAGQVLGGKYRVVRPLGQGGMGAVLEAEHALTHKRVAIKWMHPHIARDPEAQARFLREAQASARVRHPHIVDVYDVVKDGDAVFLVMELLDGEPLSALLERGGMPIHKLIALLLPALRAVSAAHRQGVIHRDLKPDNIFLARHADTENAVAKVLDFGISKVTDPSGLSLTRTGATMGTPMYMPLEQLVGEKSIDARADVYALGVILYEAVTGRRPFEAETFSELAIKIATTDPPPPKQLRPELPTALARLISWAMAKKREERLDSVEALVRELEPFALERSFRAQMTAQEATLPCVPGDSGKPSTPRHAIPTTPVVAGRHPVEASQTFRARQHGGDASDTRSIKPLWPRVAALSALAVSIAALAVWGLLDDEPLARPVPSVPIVGAAAADARALALPKAPPPTIDAGVETKSPQGTGSPASQPGVPRPSKTSQPTSTRSSGSTSSLKRPAKVEPPRAGRAIVDDF